VRSGSEGSPASTDEETLTVQEAWEELRRYVSVRSWRTSTPGEVARWAVRNDGLPADAVGTLRDAFRAVEYGGRSGDSYRPTVSAAIETIRASQREDEEDETS
jgi:hypothetical protein